MKKAILEFIKPAIIYYSTRHLSEKDVNGKLNTNLKKKIVKSSSTGIGKELGIEPDSSIESIPMTGYDFYVPFYKNPQEGDFMYPLKDYVRSMTSGTMGKPKTYLTPLPGIRQHIRNTGLSLIFVSTFDGERYNFSFGDTFYVNIPGGSFISSIVAGDMSKKQSDLVRIVPENRENMTFQEKVDYFVGHYKEIDIAQMNVTTLLDDIQPRIQDKLKLKALITMDASAGQLKERVKDFIGSYPKTPYGSTESIASTLPSIEYPGGFFFDWRVIYPEFIPFDKAITEQITRVDDPPKTRKLDEVQIGKLYQLVITMLYTDLTRNITSDILECISLEDKSLKVKTPIFQFHSRADRLLALHNFTRINEQEIFKVLERAAVQFVDYTAQKELHGTKEYMRLYIEFDEEIDIDNTTKRIHDAFMEIDKNYYDLTTMMEYKPLKVTPIPKGSFKKFLQTKDGMSRIARIKMREDRLKILLGEATS